MNRLLAWSAALLWCVLIFSLSAQPAAVSNELSKGMTEALIDQAEKIIPGGEFNLGKLNHIVRKNAHFFLYLVLGILVINALRQSGKRGLGAYMLALLISVLYSMTDEFHQLYVPGRGAQVRDVLIDSAGAVVGLAGYFLLRELGREGNKS